MTVKHFESKMFFKLNLQDNGQVVSCVAETAKLVYSCSDSNHTTNGIHGSKGLARSQVLFVFFNKTMNASATLFHDPHPDSSQTTRQLVDRVKLKRLSPPQLLHRFSVHICYSVFGRHLCRPDRYQTCHQKKMEHQTKGTRVMVFSDSPSGHWLFGLCTRALGHLQSN